MMVEIQDNDGDGCTRTLYRTSEKNLMVDGLNLK